MKTSIQPEQQIPWWLSKQIPLTRWEHPIKASNIKAMFSIIHDDCPVKVCINGVMHDITGMDQRIQPGQPIEIVLNASIQPTEDVVPNRSNDAPNTLKDSSCS